MEKGKERLREKAIAALMSSRTVEVAASKIGVSARTLSRWMADPEFKAAYTEAKREFLRRGLSNLARQVFDASKVLGDIARQKGKPNQSARAGAATAIIRLSLDASFMDDIEERIRKLEAHNPNAL